MFRQDQCHPLSVAMVDRTCCDPSRRFFDLSVRVMGSNVTGPFGWRGDRDGVPLLAWRPRRTDGRLFSPWMNETFKLQAPYCACSFKKSWPL